MQENFVSYDLAFKLKKLGFDEKCYGRYINGELKFYPHSKIYEPNSDTNASDMCNAPTILELLKWLREVRGINIIINYDFSYSLEKEYYSFRIRKFDKNELVIEIVGDTYDTYEQALGAALEVSLKIIEDESNNN